MFNDKIIKEMFFARLHLGHFSTKWNPKMKKYVFCKQNGKYIIDLIQTVYYLKKVCNFIKKLSIEGKKILFVSARMLIVDKLKHFANVTKSFYITEDWLGGTFTNWITTKGCIDKLNYYSVDGLKLYDSLTKRERLISRKQQSKLAKYYFGIKQMKKIPDVVFLIGQSDLKKAIGECLKLNVPTISILDTDCDPTMTNFFIPANDDSISSIFFILDFVKYYMLKGGKKISKRLVFN
uniref:Small ribosomal subunit protein uS2c n=1 Tax=Euglena longa TaxID=3037 RepID=RR2_EUGLO|nr:ribosomal protein S2 [Euglena longa]P24352.2 RecName: Full=Small ribosomal subunit protein uS2c; AltName: Full=Plastid 30S ribosomal protein S2 [Euglena longa]CAC24580.1 ribosomal protein S2 [Euglena longa]